MTDVIELSDLTKILDAHHIKYIKVCNQYNSSEGAVVIVTNEGDLSSVIYYHDHSYWG